MNKSFICAFVGVLCVLPSWGMAAEQPPALQWQAGVASLENSRALAQSLGEQLQAALTQAMAEQGPVAAIRVCRDVAPQIAAELSRQSGAKIGRISRRFRNPLNAPETWQRTVLENQFSDAVAEAQRSVEYFVNDEKNDDNEVRYMKAIHLGGVCVTCHGQELSAEVARALDEHYPHDLARGYALGELRGAFSVTWPE